MRFIGGAESSPIVVFDNTEVAYNGKDWTYNNAQYWFPQHEHSFVAITPVSAFDAGNDHQYSNSTLSLKYTLPDNFESAHDLLVATHRRMYKENSISSFDLPVKLGFFHIMSRVNFLVTYDNPADKITVTKIELEGINKTSTFTITPAPLLSDSRQTDDYSSSWADFSNKGTLTANINVSVADEEVHPLFPDDNAMFVIPQPHNREVIMSITYIYDDDTEYEEQVLTAQEPIGGWEPGKVYTYSLTIHGFDRLIDMGPISVKEWMLGSDNDVDVPRK